MKRQIIIGLFLMNLALSACEMVFYPATPTPLSPTPNPLPDSVTLYHPGQLLPESVGGYLVPQFAVAAGYSNLYTDVELSQPTCTIDTGATVAIDVAFSFNHRNLILKVRSEDCMGYTGVSGLQIPGAKPGSESESDLCHYSFRAQETLDSAQRVLAGFVTWRSSARSAMEALDQLRQQFAALPIPARAQGLDNRVPLALKAAIKTVEMGKNDLSSEEFLDARDTIESVRRDEACW